MNLLKNNKTFEFFPVLDLKLLRDNQHDNVGLMGCNMQIATVQDNFLDKNIKNILNKQEKNIVNLKSDLYFYTGLKQYYKINIKKDILSDYFIEERKKLLYLNKDKTEKSAFLSGDCVFPVKNSYEFLKRRFILNLHNRNRLKTREALVERHVDTINQINNNVLSSLLLKSYQDRNLPKVRFYYDGADRNEAGNFFSCLGIPGFFLHKYSCVFRFDFVKLEKEEVFFMRKNFLKLAYIIKYLPNRHYFLVQYISSNLNNKKFVSLLDNKNNLFIRNLIKEFMTIKLFLRFFLTHLKKAYDYRVSPKKMVYFLKINNIVFNMARRIYSDIFQYVFRLSVMEIIHPSLSSYSFLNMNSLRIANIYSSTNAIETLLLFPINFNENGHSGLSFSDFETGKITRQALVLHNIQSTNVYRKKPRVYRYKKKLFNIRYRNLLFSRRYKLLEKHNSIYFENKVQLKIK